jgi:RNA polymerase sigma factor (sigma-70 family)
MSWWSNRVWRRISRTRAPIEELNDGSPGPEFAPDETLEARSRVDRIRAVLDAVEVRTREIYIAHRAGYSYGKIAERMNISQRPVKRHIVRALVAIMENIEKEAGAGTSDVSRGG